MADPSNVVRLTTERRERADRQRALASAYRFLRTCARPSCKPLRKPLSRSARTPFGACRGLGASGCLSGGT
jgi:hypothetical protein